jgi:hypothetical protein
MRSNQYKKNPRLIVERSRDQFWGRASVNGNLIIEQARSLDVLKKKMKTLICHFEGVTVNEFDVCYDLTSFFIEYSYLNISEIANKAGISPAIMRQYTSGLKYPSPERLAEIENAIHEIGKQLTKVKLRRVKKVQA